MTKTGQAGQRKKAKFLSPCSGADSRGTLLAATARRLPLRLAVWLEMTNQPNHIWSVPIYLPYVKPKLTDAAVRDAEQRLGVALPAAYLELLGVQNGGCIRYRLEGIPHREIYGIGANYPSLVYVTWDEVREHVSFSLDGLIPFDGDGHWYLCLDYRDGSKSPRSKSADPRITFVDIELDRESHVADSFAEYLAQLRLDVSPGTYVYMGHEGIKHVLMTLGLHLGSSFEQADPVLYGINTLCARLGPEDDPDWVWATPNQVPKGYVHEGEVCCPELLPLTRALGLTFPELPERALLLAASVDGEERMLAACRQAGVEITPLRELVA